VNRVLKVTLPRKVRYSSDHGAHKNRLITLAVFVGAVPREAATKVLCRVKLITLFILLLH